MREQALLDGKDLCPEFDFLFDNCNCIEFDCKVMGAIEGIPVVLEYTCGSNALWVVVVSARETDISKVMNHIESELQQGCKDYNESTDDYKQIVTRGKQEHNEGAFYFWWEIND